jgi:hypothetical protein
MRDAARIASASPPVRHVELCRFIIAGVLSSGFVLWLF